MRRRHYELAIGAVLVVAALLYVFAPGVLDWAVGSWFRFLTS